MSDNWTVVVLARNALRDIRDAQERFEAAGDLASALREERIRQRWPAKEIAEHLGITPQYFNDLELGRRSLATDPDRLELWIEFLSIHQVGGKP